MTTLATLFDVTPPTIPSPLCSQHCPKEKRGRAVVGELRDYGACVNHRIDCLTCGASVEISTRKDLP